jgi:hypothetical protein
MLLGQFNNVQSAARKPRISADWFQSHRVLILTLQTNRKKGPPPKSRGNDNGSPEQPQSLSREPLPSEWIIMYSSHRNLNKLGGRIDEASFQTKKKGLMKHLIPWRGRRRTPKTIWETSRYEQNIPHQDLQEPNPPPDGSD